MFIFILDSYQQKKYTMIIWLLETPQLNYT